MKMTAKTGVLLIIAFALVLGIILASGRASSQDVAQQTDQTGRFQAVAPNLVIDSVTGEVQDAQGQVIVNAIDPNGADIGRYSAAGFVTRRDTSITANGRVMIVTNLAKGVSVVDTVTGRLLVDSQIYAMEPAAGSRAY